MPDLEGVGEAVTGGMLGRAVEPGAGEAGLPGDGKCLNCGCVLTGSYCHCCGQKARVHRTIAAWWHDFVHSVLHLDGKFWRTLPLLAWRPGELTRRYSHGERAKFISPLALFLFTVFFMFAVFSIAGPKLGGLGLNETVSEALAEERQKLQELRSERAGAPAAEAERLDERIADTAEDITRLEQLQRKGVATVPLIEAGDVEGDTFFKAAVAKAQENPELLLYKVQANAYKFSWALIPISVPFLWILFLHKRRYRREFTAYDHLVFVTYSIAFMSLVLVAFVLLSAIGLTAGIVGAIFMLIPPVHMYRQLRGAYGLSRFSALWRTVALLTFASIALTLFWLLLLALGALA